MVLQLRPVLEQPLHQPGPPEGTTKLNKSVLKIIILENYTDYGEYLIRFGVFSVLLFSTDLYETSPFNKDLHRKEQEN